LVSFVETEKDKKRNREGLRAVYDVAARRNKRLKKVKSQDSQKVLALFGFSS